MCLVVSTHSPAQPGTQAGQAQVSGGHRLQAGLHLDTRQHIINISLLVVGMVAVVVGGDGIVVVVVVVVV